MCNSASINSCYECIAGYVLAADNYCMPCPPNCLTCTFSSARNLSVCRFCNASYVLDNAANACVICPTACAVCSVFDQKVCLVCWDGWRVNSNNGCTRCDSNCNKCDKDGNCVELPIGYVLDNYLAVASGNLNGNIHRCPQQCYTCDQFNPAKCTECSPNTYLSNNLCLPCPIYCL